MFQNDLHLLLIEKSKTVWKKTKTRMIMFGRFEAKADLRSSSVLIHYMYVCAKLYSSILFEPVLSGDWTAVYPEIDLETTPLEIKTDSTIGSGDKVYAWFYTSGGDYVGYVHIYFSSTPQYYISYCMSSYTNFPVSLPTEVEKVWRITLNRNSGIRLLIHCNNVVVVNILMSSSTCSRSSWSTYWSRTVGKIWFYPDRDTASDYYRAGQTGKDDHM